MGQGRQEQARASRPERRAAPGLFLQVWVWGSSLSVNPLVTGEFTSYKQAGSCLCRFYWDMLDTSLRVWPPLQDPPTLPDMLSEWSCDSQGRWLRE